MWMTYYSLSANRLSTELLNVVFGKLEEADMTANLKKCSFLVSEVQFLGFVITLTGIAKDAKYVEMMKGLPAPTTTKELQHVLGLTMVLKIGT